MCMRSWIWRPAHHLGGAPVRRRRKRTRGRRAHRIERLAHFSFALSHLPPRAQLTSVSASYKRRSHAGHPQGP
jgi:hypothetical protein